MHFPEGCSKGRYNYSTKSLIGIAFLICISFSCQVSIDIKPEVLFEASIIYCFKYCAFAKDLGVSKVILK